jgi:integrase
MRPAEWIGLEWRNNDRVGRVAYVEQALVDGEQTKTKTAASRRAVPLTDRALAALDAVERRELEWRLVFTTTRGKPIDLRRPAPSLERRRRACGPRNLQLRPSERRPLRRRSL